LSREVQVIPVVGLPKIAIGDDISTISIPFLEQTRLARGDIVVVTHSIVSIAEGAIYKIGELKPSERAIKIAEVNNRSPVLVEASLKEAVEILHESPVLITKTRLGIITDYSGIDTSNAPEGFLIALPRDPDKSAEAISKSLSDHFGFSVPVVIADTQGRPWRKGAINIAIGLARISPLVDNSGAEDLYGKPLRGSPVCLADEIASMAELVMGQSNEGIPIAIVRGVSFAQDGGSARDILRGDNENLF
jgi:coenzyme F420-0:L-glutamate ligase/coenzyme F420-1:gamma-L-glutamate ligase